jgi:putative oxidoreductase
MVTRAGKNMKNYLRHMTFGPIWIRIVVGVIFIITGWPKLYDVQQTQSFFTMIGLPQELAVIIGLLEVVGGTLLLAGILTRILAFLFVIEMIGAITILNTTFPFPIPEGYEIAQLSVPMLSLAISLSLIFTGPGRISVEWDVLKRELIPSGRDMVYSIRKQLQSERLTSS